jgi:hypothetical protein
VTGIEIAVGYLFAWAVRKARRVGERADGEVDRVLDARMDRLHELVSQRLGEVTVLDTLAEEAESGQAQLSERTSTRVRLALEQAAEQDPEFAEALRGLVQELHELTTGSATGGAANNAISGGTFSGPVLQGRDFSGLSFASPPPPLESGNHAVTGQG